MSGTKNRWFLVSCLLAVALVAFVGGSQAMKVTDSAAFCGGCHVMSEAALTHRASTHAKIACNECHAPHDLVQKLPFKALAGFNDIWNNTFTNLPDVIHAQGKHPDVINANCKRCHSVTNVNVDMSAKKYCTDCHRNVPHMSHKPISTRKAADA